MVAPALGPVLGGYLVEFASWRYIFWLNVPVGAVALAMGIRALPNIPPGRVVGALDTLGIVLAPLAFASLSFGISESDALRVDRRADRDRDHGRAGGAGAVHLARADLPAPPARAARLPQPGLHDGHRDAVGGLRVDVRQLLPHPALPPAGARLRVLESGLVTIPQALASMVFMQVGGRLFDRVGARPPVLVGLLLVAGSMTLMSRVTGTTTGVELIPALLLMGAGMGLMMKPTAIRPSPDRSIFAVRSPTSCAKTRWWSILSRNS